MTTTSYVSIAKDFSRFPAGRYESDGPYSGEAFRKRVIEPHLKKGEALTIDLDGVLGYGSSFLEEAFGGLIRDGFRVADLRRLLTFLSKTDPSVEREIMRYIQPSE